MPLVVLTGLPSSGKSTASLQLAEFMRGEGKEVLVVGEAQLLGEAATRDSVFRDSSKEKELRARTKAEVNRLISKDKVVICDALNYIKGFRYELYCLSKSSKTPQVTVWCDLSPPDCLVLNDQKKKEEQYSKEIFQELIDRYEAPQETNRWDCPLFLVLKDRPVPCQDIFNSLFHSLPPPPNLSTQNKPLSSTDFLHDLDRLCGELVQTILEAQSLGEEVVTLAGRQEKLRLERHYTLPELARHKRQFMVYIKQRALTDLDKIKVMFLQYLNANLTL